jgi:hypothetical protein
MTSPTAHGSEIQKGTLPSSKQRPLRSQAALVLARSTCDLAATRVAYPFALSTRRDKPPARGRHYEALYKDLSAPRHAPVNACYCSFSPCRFLSCCSSCASCGCDGVACSCLPSCCCCWWWLRNSCFDSCRCHLRARHSRRTRALERVLLQVRICFSSLLISPSMLAAFDHVLKFI